MIELCRQPKRISCNKNPAKAGRTHDCLKKERAAWDPDTQVPKAKVDAPTKKGIGYEGVVQV